MKLPYGYIIKLHAHHKATSVDCEMEELITCGDCMYGNQYEIQDHKFMFCEKTEEHHELVEVDDWCSRAVRRKT